MSVRTTYEKQNPLLGRRDVAFFVDHPQKGTCRLYEVRKAIAEKFGVDEQVVYVTRLETVTGTNRSQGTVEIYHSADRADTLVPAHIKARNLPTRGKDAS
jgi:ribosomal protein S24E